MPAKCPKCGEMLEEEYICCADVEISYKCDSCGKLSKGFVVPFGRCHLCGGKLQVVKGYTGSESSEEVQIVHDALQLEVNNYVLYNTLQEQTDDPEIKEVFRELYEEEKHHIAELQKKYHVSFDYKVLESERAKDNMFLGIAIDPSTRDPKQLLEKAILMEKAAKEFYQKQAASARGTKQTIYKELAAEEEEHQAMLETKLARLNK